MVIGRGVAGVGAGKSATNKRVDMQADPESTGGEYSVCTTQAVECADSTDAMRKRRGLLVAVSTNVAIISGFVGSSIVSLIVIAAYGGKASDGVWRICFGIGCVVSLSSSTETMRSFAHTPYSYPWSSLSSAGAWQTHPSTASTPSSRIFLTSWL